MKYYLGIDGGGTKTKVAVGDENGLIFKKEGKSINFYSVGIDAARKNLSDLISEVESTLDTKCFEAVVIGCSALDSEADDELIKKLCAGIINANLIEMNSDVHIALEAVGEAKSPCVAVCGTGSMAIGKDCNGTIHVTGGWGHIVGDEGSAYSIALDGLKLCCAQCDKGENTRLLQSANRFFSVTDFRKAIDIIYSPETTKDVIASFASCVGSLADSGDETAVEIIIRQAKKFAVTVLILLEKINSCDVLCLYGGVLENNPLFTKAFCERIKEKYPELKITRISTSPEECALNLARKK